MGEKKGVAFSGPLYEQVQQVLRSRILAGEWDPKEALPGEVTLSEEFGVSIGTVRRAMDQLTRERILIRERGRGTFVRGDANLQSTRTFHLQGLDGQPLEPQIRLVQVDELAATSWDVAALKLRRHHNSTPRVLKLSREWKVGDLLLCAETIVVEHMRFPGLRSEVRESDESLFSTFAEVYRTKVDRFQWVACSAKQPQLAVLKHNIASGEPTMLVNRTALDARGVPIEVSERLVFLAQCHVVLAS